MEIKLNLGLRRSIIPPRTGRSIPHIPPTAGFHRSVVSARPVGRLPSGTVRRVKPIQPSSIFHKPNSLPLLENLLAWGEIQKQEVLGMLKLVTPDFEEYDILVSKLDRLEQVLDTTKQQIARLIEGQ